MGKKRIIKKSGETNEEQGNLQIARSKAVSIKKKISKGVIYILSTYNNTLITLADESGNAIFQTSSGALGFKGSKKGTPYAASRAAEVIAEFSSVLGVKDVEIHVKNVGPGREAAIRALVHRGFNINKIKDVTPIPHGTPRLAKPRRV